jgi:hypothetical protein
MTNAQVVIDPSNAPSFEDKAVRQFFETSGRNPLPAEAAAGVRHHVALSIIATDGTDNGYFRAKVAQEKLIEASRIPYTIVRATQFMEFLGGIADSSTAGNTVRLPPMLFQPIAADDVAAVIAEVALVSPRDGIVEIAGSGPSTVPRIRRSLSEGGRRPTRGRERSRVRVFRRPSRRALARAVGRSAPRPHHSRRMASPLTGRLILRERRFMSPGFRLLTRRPAR